MGYFHKVAQKKVGAEGRFVVIWNVRKIAEIYVSILERLEILIVGIFGGKGLQIVVGVAVVFHNPLIGVVCLGKNRFEIERHRAVTLQILENKVESGVLVKTSGY